MPLDYYIPQSEWDIDFYNTRNFQVHHHYASGMNTPISDFAPHYTNERFKQAQTVWLARGSRLGQSQYGGEVVNGAEYNYSDRLDSWYGYEKSRDAWKKAMESAGCTSVSSVTARCVQIYLRDLTGDQNLRLVHILAGFNVSNGYPYQVFGYIPGNKSTDKENA